MMDIAKGDRVHGAPGVFYVGEAGVGTVLNLLDGGHAHVELLDGDRVVVPVNLLVKEE